MAACLEILSLGRAGDGVPRVAQAPLGQIAGAESGSYSLPSSPLVPREQLLALRALLLRTKGFLFSWAVFLAALPASSNTLVAVFLPAALPGWCL